MKIVPNLILELPKEVAYMLENSLSPVGLNNPEIL